MLRKQLLAMAQNFVVYYGYGKEDELSVFDLVVVESQGQTRDSVRKLQDKGTLVLAYLSVMEIQSFALEYALLKEEDFLHGLGEDGEKLTNEAYSTYLLDLSSARWQRLLLHRAGQLINSGYDGFFLDTIGDIDTSLVPIAFHSSQLMGAASILKQLREAFPEHLLIQNNGLERLYKCTAMYLDGICWEIPPDYIGADENWVRQAWRRIDYLKKEIDLRVLLLLDRDSKEAGKMVRDIATENGYLFYRAPREYIEI